VVVDARNDMSGSVSGHVVQAGHVDQVILSGPPPEAVGGLPPEPAEFVGRGPELAALLTLLDPAAEGRPVLVTAIAGLAGVGKTTLALRAAHQACANGWYPGGVLFVNLRGYDTAGQVDASAALAAFLQELGVAPDHIPPGQPAREALYRSRLASRAAVTGGVLVVLDNASSAEQVRPLLPAHPKNRSLITSRHTLADLAGARQLGVDVLEPSEAVALVATALGDALPLDPRVAADAAGVGELAQLCGFLPLALRIVAAILIDDSRRPIRELVDELRDTSSRLGELTYGDSLAMHAAFDLSYTRLNPAERRMFRLLSLSPGPQVSVAAAVALAGAPEAQTRKLLRALHRAHMITAAGAAGWYRLHDLLRLYAVHRAGHEDDQQVRNEATTRLLDYYIETASAAVNQLRPESMRAHAMQRFTNRQDALAWLDAERLCLVGAIRLGYETGRHLDALDLASLLSGYFDLRKHWDDWESTQRLALSAARRLADRERESRSLNSIGNIARQLRKLNTALEHYGQALDIRREIGDRYGEAVVLNNIGSVHRNLGQAEIALDRCTQALRIHRELGDRHGEALTLNNLGSIQRQTGDLGSALEHDLKSLGLHRQIGDLRGEAQALNNLGNDYRLSGLTEQAISSCRRALELHREVGDRYGAAQTQFNLGLAYLASGGQRGLVDECWEQARAIFTDCGDGRESENVRIQLASVDRESQLPTSTPSRATASFYYHSEPGQQGSGY
jgi:tetratricopeptide (TPR) repeat protein